MDMINIAIHPIDENSFLKAIFLDVQKYLLPDIHCKKRLPPGCGPYGMNPNL
jgi:hypothetical protein